MRSHLKTRREMESVVSDDIFLINRIDDLHEFNRMECAYVSIRL